MSEEVLEDLLREEYKRIETHLDSISRKEQQQYLEGYHDAIDSLVRTLEPGRLGRADQWMAYAHAVLDWATSLSAITIATPTSLSTESLDVYVKPEIDRESIRINMHVVGLPQSEQEQYLNGYANSLENLLNWLTPESDLNPFEAVQSMGALKSFAYSTLSYRKLDPEPLRPKIESDELGFARLLLSASDYQTIRGIPLSLSQKLTLTNYVILASKNMPISRLFAGYDHLLQ